jgi:glyoxalase family protein
MDSVVRSLHHVTATVSDAQEDLDFFANILGMRLVKKTVNFDNHHVYHFYYGNEQGLPGTIMTTFPYKGMGVRTGVHGAGQITVTSLSVPTASLTFWKERLRQQGFTAEDEAPRFGEDAIRVRDPSGLMIRLVASPSDHRKPWITTEIDAAHAIRGIHSITMLVRDPARSLQLLTDVLGFTVVGEMEKRSRVAVNGDAAGRVIEIVSAPDSPAAVNGLGTVHHVAMAIDTADEQLRMRGELVRLGYQVTEVRDRQYFRSIYFREPGGVLYEIATVPPGFTIDEDLAGLGCALKLPPWEEPHRADIEAHLPRIAVPRGVL